jgi:long-chain fatty acid transport protein
MRPASVDSFRTARRAGVATLCAILVAIPASAGGVYLYEKSALDVALASAGWTARADDASTIFSNPAGLTRLEGTRLDVSLIPIGLDVAFTPDDATTVEGADGDASDWLPAGGAFYSRRLSDKTTFGFGVGGYFGLAQEYEDGWVGRYYVEKIQVQALTLEPAVGIRLNEAWSLGVGLAVHYGIFNQTAAVNNNPILLPGPVFQDGQLELDTTDWTVQGNLGLLWEGGGKTRIGFQFLTPAKLSFSDVPEFTDLRPALEQALAAAGILGARLDLGMEMPMALRVGFHCDVAEDWSLMGDLGWEQWSRFGKVDVAVVSEEITSLTTDRNYEDVWHLGLGARRRLSEDWLLNFGAAWDSAIVEDADRTPDLALGASLRLGIGATRELANGGEISFAYEAALAGDLPMDVSRGPLAGRVVGEYRGATIHFLALTWGRSF